MKRSAYFIAILAMIGLMGYFSIGPLTGLAYGRGNMYEEFDGIMIFYTPKDTTTYRQL